MSTKNLIVTTAVLAFIIGSTTKSYAVMANPDPMIVTNPDGTTLTIRMYGDEWFNYTTTDDGYLITKAADGFFHYATVCEGVEVASKYIATNANLRTAEVNAMLSGIDTPLLVDQLQERRAKELKENETLTGGPQLSATDPTKEKTTEMPTKGKIHFPVILVNFPDKDFNFSKDQFEDWLMKEGYNFNGGCGASNGSVNDYFKAASNGQFDPQFDLYGPYTAPENHDYYSYSPNNSFVAVADLAADICNMANEDIDFSQYDNNNDNYIDIVYIVYAGYGAADSGDKNNIWPHKWSIYGGTKYTWSGPYLYLDGKMLHLYGCSPEYSYGKYFTTIGTFCHEFGHAIGLGDHYDTEYNSDTRGPGKWDIMASGNYNQNGNCPPLFSAYERSVLGWTNIPQLTERGVYTLRANNTSEAYDDAFMIPTEDENEYYIFENRQQTGWDTYLPHHGMLVWHIDYDKTVWSANTINTTGSHQYIDLVEAGGVDNTDETATPYPGSTSNTRFTDDSSPSMLSWDGNKLNSPITAIAESNNVITFDFKGGEAIASALKLNEVEATYNAATMSWTPLDGITDYYVSISEKDADSPLVKEAEATGNSYTIETLTPKTDYTYTVGHMTGDKWAEAYGTFTTPNTPLSERYPENVVTTDYGHYYFETEWDALEGAETYTLNLYTGETDDDDSTLTLTPVTGKRIIIEENATSARVQDLEPSTEYYYTIVGHSATEDSKESAVVFVTTSDDVTGIDTIAVDSSEKISVYTATGLPVGGSVSINDLKSPGIYIVKIGQKAYKVVAK